MCLFIKNENERNDNHSHSKFYKNFEWSLLKPLKMLMLRNTWQILLQKLLKSVSITQKDF